MDKNAGLSKSKKTFRRLGCLGQQRRRGISKPAVPRESVYLPERIQPLPQRCRSFRWRFRFFRYRLLYLRPASYHPWHSAEKKRGHTDVPAWVMMGGDTDKTNPSCFQCVQRLFSPHWDIPFRQSSPVAIPSPQINRFLCIYGQRSGIMHFCVTGQIRIYCGNRQILPEYIQFR